MEFTDEQVSVIQNEFRKFPRYPTVVKLAYDFKTTVSNIIDVINRNERIGAFVYRNSVYTWRHIRQFEYLILQGTPKNEIMSIMGIGSETGWKVFYERLKQWKEIEKANNKNSRIENADNGRFNFEEVLNMTVNYDVNSEKVKEVIRLTGLGCSQRSIGSQIGVSKSYVQQVQVWLRNHGYFADKKGAESSADTPEKPETPAKPEKPKTPEKPKKPDVPEKPKEVPIENEKDPEVGNNKEPKTIVATKKPEADPVSAAADDLCTKLRNLWLKIGCALPSPDDPAFRSIAVAVKDCCANGADVGMFVDEGGVTITIEGEDVSFTMDRSYRSF